MYNILHFCTKHTPLGHWTNIFHTMPVLPAKIKLGLYLG